MCVCVSYLSRRTRAPTPPDARKDRRADACAARWLTALAVLTTTTCGETHTHTHTHCASLCTRTVKHSSSFACVRAQARSRECACVCVCVSCHLTVGYRGESSLMSTLTAPASISACVTEARAANIARVDVPSSNTPVAPCSTYTHSHTHTHMLADQFGRCTAGGWHPMCP